MAAGLATLGVLREPGAYERLTAQGEALAQAARDAGARHGVPVQVAAAGGMWGFFLADRPVHSYADAKTNDTAAFGRLFHAMLGAGVYLAPSAYEANFLSVMHDDATLAATHAAFERGFAAAAA
jgi:glutamate-1-semialdehyde 2,1-aminomutase